MSSKLPSKPPQSSGQSGRISLNVSASSYSGPIPGPDVLAQYSAIQPDLVNRIVSMAEKQADHRQSLEKHLVESNILHEKLGIYCGFGVAIAGLAAATVCALTGHGVTGGIIATVDLVGLVGVFILRTRSKPDEASMGAP